MIIIIRFGENYVLGQNISIDTVSGVGRGSTWFALHFSFIIHKKRKNYKNFSCHKNQLIE